VGGKPYTPINTFKKWDSNSICDVTGFKRKLSEQVERWEGFMVIPEAWNVRQSQRLGMLDSLKTFRLYQHRRPFTKRLDFKKRYLLRLKLLRTHGKLLRLTTIL